MKRLGQSAITTGSVDATFYDVHIEVDTLGSMEQYSK